MTCPLADQCLAPKCRGGATWAAKSCAAADVEAFKTDVVKVMKLTGWPLKRAMAATFKGAMTRAGQCLLS